MFPETITKMHTFTVACNFCLDPRASACYGIHSSSTNPLHNCTVALLEVHHSDVQLFVACVNHSVYIRLFVINCKKEVCIGKKCTVAPCCVAYIFGETLEPFAQTQRIANHKNCKVGEMVAVASHNTFVHLC